MSLDNSNIFGNGSEVVSSRGIYLFDLQFLKVLASLRGNYKLLDSDRNVSKPSVINLDSVLDFSELVFNNEIDVNFSGMQNVKDNIYEKVNCSALLPEADLLKQFVKGANDFDDLIECKNDLVRSVALIGKRNSIGLHLVKYSICNFINTSSTYNSMSILNVYSGVSSLDRIDGSEEFNLDEINNTVLVYIYCMYEAFKNYFKLPMIFKIDADYIIDMANEYLQYLKTLL